VDFPTSIARRAAETLNRAWIDLDEEARAAVCALSGECRRSGELQVGTFQAGDISADAYFAGGVLWRVNGEHGFASAAGVHQIPADLPMVIRSADEMAEIAAHWALMTDVFGETAEPARAKHVLAACRTQHTAMLKFHRSMTGAAPCPRELREHLTLIGDRVRQLGQSVQARAASNEGWRRAFDEAGWQVARS
jgi:hypothetical protein